MIHSVMCINHRFQATSSSSPTKISAIQNERNFKTRDNDRELKPGRVTWSRDSSGNGLQAVAKPTLTWSWKSISSLNDKQQSCWCSIGQKQLWQSSCLHRFHHLVLRPSSPHTLTCVRTTANYLSWPSVDLTELDSQFRRLFLSKPQPLTSPTYSSGADGTLKSN